MRIIFIALFLFVASVAAAQEIKLNRHAHDAIATMQSLGYKKIDSSFSGQSKKRFTSVSSPYIKKFGLGGHVSLLFNEADTVTSAIYVFDRCVKDDYLIVIDSLNAYYGDHEKPISKDLSGSVAGWHHADTLTTAALISGQIMVQFISRK